MRTIRNAGLATVALAVLSAGAQANDDVYADFPITVKGYSGDATNSVAYTGQIARQLLHDALKVLAAQGNGQANADLKAKMMAYFEGGDGAAEIVAPKASGPFDFVQSSIHDISSSANLVGKTYGGAITGWPNSPTGAELLAFWIDKASSADKGYDVANGYNYAQLISKFMIGAVFYNQAVDNYLDENLAADVKPNDQPYGDGSAYTGKEHSWDEAFGYFGIPAHALQMAPSDIYYTARVGRGADDPEAVFAAADYNKDGKIDLYTEMAYQPAYYSSSFDAEIYDEAGEKTSYVHEIAKAFLEGRQLITAADGAKLTDAQRGELKAYAETIETNWERVLAEATFKYAGEVYEDLEKIQVIVGANGDTDDAAKALANHWSELKGFSLALQAGRKNLGETAVRLNRLVGFSPVLPNSSQVVDIDSDGNYVKGQGDIGEYMLHMLKVQQLMVDEFDVKARTADQLAHMKSMMDKIGSGSTAEND